LAHFSHYEAAGSWVTVNASWLMSWVTGSWKDASIQRTGATWRKGADRHVQCDTSGARYPSGNEYLEVDLQGTNVGASPEWTHNLWQLLGELRRQTPMLAGTGGIFDAIPDLPNMWMAQPDQPTFLTLDFETTRTVLMTLEVYSSARGGPETIVMGPRSMTQTDGSYHSRLRKLVMPTFRKSTMARWRSECMEPALAHLMEPLRKRERFDALAEFLFPFPYLVTAGVIGFSEELL
jgi:hypothetical protein